MDRRELKEIIQRVIEQVKKDKAAPQPACLYGDNQPPPGPTTMYAVGEES
jgi:hypothetical protein